MHQRSTDIRLMPEIERPCMADLGKLCVENNQDGEVFRKTSFCVCSPPFLSRFTAMFRPHRNAIPM